MSLQKEPYEYSAYGSTFKLSHDIAPAGAALGAAGCADCHRKDAPFFTHPYMTDPFGADGKIKFTSAYKMLKYSAEALKEQTQER
jgi:mono/diheme cytochrome c family protein